MVLIQANPVDSYISGIPYHSRLERDLFEMTAYFRPGYEEDPDYISRKWDGRDFALVRSPEGHTLPTGLLHNFSSYLQAIGVELTMFNTYPKWVKHPELSGMQNVPLRPYQVSCVMPFLTPPPNIRMGGVLQAGTGAGKTRCAAKLVQLMAVPTLFIVNQTALLEQARKEFIKLLGVEVGQIGDNIYAPRLITVATIQSLARAFDLVVAKADDDDDDDIDGADLQKRALREIRKELVRDTVTQAQLVIFDEVHGVAARTPYAVLRECKNALAVAGLSASPWRDDGLSILIEAACGHVTHKITASQLITLGWLVPVEIVVQRMPDPDYYHKDLHSDIFAKKYRAWVVENPYRNARILEIAYDHISQGHVVIILVKMIDHGKDLEQQLLHSTFLNGKIRSRKKREEILDKIKSGETRCLIATSLADQGLDIPIASVIILAGGGKSSTRALQRIGRVLRTEDGEQLHPGHTKQRAYVYDIVDKDTSLRNQFYERVRIYKTEPAFVIRDSG